MGASAAGKCRHSRTDATSGGVAPFSGTQPSRWERLLLPHFRHWSTPAGSSQEGRTRLFSDGHFDDQAAKYCFVPADCRSFQRYPRSLRRARD
jgi:hypothetical protein